MNPKQDLKLLATMQLLIALLMGIPTILATYYHETIALHSFVVSLCIMLVCSAVTLLFTWHTRSDNMSIKDGLFFVTFTWIISTAFASLPLYLSGSYPSYADAYFEIMSGFTTTGATVLSEIEDHPLSILFWRSETNWLGGMGIVVLFVAFLPTLGVRGTMLVGAESVGPTKDKLTPKITHTAAILWGIYIVFSLAEALLLLFGGLSPYEAVTVTFSTMSAAGFCVKNNSIGFFQSCYVDIVVTFFMLASGANFSLYYRLLQGKGKQVLRDGELRWYIGIFSIAAFLSAICLSASHTYGNFFTSLRYAAFQTASILTTTGFSTANYLHWPQFSQMLLFLLFFVGGCAGSAGGGIKVIRVRTMMALGKNTLIKRLHPNAVLQTRIGDQVLSPEITLGIADFVGVYFATGLMGTLLVSLSGVDFATSISSSFLCLGNIGIGFGDVGPTGNFGAFPAWCKWIFSFLMMAGRLELFTVYALFTKEFWKKQA